MSKINNIIFYLSIYAYVYYKAIHNIEMIELSFQSIVIFGFFTLITADRR
jgi:hypothetical protein